MKFIKNFRFWRLVWTLFVTYYFINFTRNFFDDAVPQKATIPTILFFILTVWLAFEYYFGSPFFQSGQVEMLPIWRGFFALFFYPFAGFCVADYVWLHWGQLDFFYPVINILGILIFSLGVLLRLYSLFILLKMEEKKFSPIGIFRILRQPRYLATMIQLIGIALALSSYWGLIFAVGIGLPLILAEVRYEEKVLVHHFKTEYINYTKSVPVLFPKFRK
jgi:protein-S-isoprenylcysteine O-methyltransferase Ste14